MELGPYAMYLMFGIPQICSSITIILIDLFTDNLPPIAIGYETAETHVMKGYPRYAQRRKDKVINCEYARMLFIDTNGVSIVFSTLLFAEQF